MRLLISGVLIFLLTALTVGSIADAGLGQDPLAAQESSATHDHPAASAAKSVQEPPEASSPSEAAKRPTKQETSAAQERSQTPAPTISREHHPWGGFEPGAWKLVRVVTETLDEQGKVVSTGTTETKTTLVKVEDDGVTLEVDVCVEVAGKRFAAEPQRVKQGFHGEVADEQLRLSGAGSGKVAIGGQVIPCKILRLESTGNSSNTVTSLYYSDTTAPYILQRESVTTDLGGKTKLSETAVHVTALDVSCEGSESLGGVSRVEAVTKHPKGTVTTSAYSSTEVPGGIVSQKSEEFDKQNHLNRRSTLQMLSYGLKVEPERTGLFGGFLGGRRRSLPIRKPIKYQQAW